MYSLVSIFILLGLSVAAIESYDDNMALCVYSISPVHVKQHNHTSGNYVDANNTQHCSRATDACFILWREYPENKSIAIYTQGCWDGNDPNCKKNECIAVKPPNRQRNTSFCCCIGNFCNSNITEGYLFDSTEPPDPARETMAYMSYSMQVVLAIVGTVALLVLLTIGYFFSHVFWKDPKRGIKSLNLVEAPPPPPPTFDLDSLEINKDTIGQGGFGSVYRGKLGDSTVAVKIFPYIHKQYFFNEREIYMLPHMKHPSIPEYIGYQERTGKDERPEYLLVLSYCPQGCLQNYLKERTLDWSQLCKMSLSIACGLSHLHSEILKDDQHRLCIAHRDLTSRNILMKADGTCMLCDFGFALQVTRSKYYVNGQEGQAEADSLAEVGTLRYKAPELLEGSVNLRDLEASLKQIDIYALGLVLWEIASRCSDLYQGLEVPSYKLPFEAEVGAHASTEQIKIAVVVRKCRPLFPEIWKATNPAVKSLKETIEDCWDQDAEARLTALCVEERISDLPELWKRHYADLTGGNLSSPVLTSNLQKSCSFNKNDINSDFYDSDQYICPRERANSLSECTTDTLLSPSTEAINVKNNLMNGTASPPSMPIQPFQGRNPCLARNLMLQQSGDLPIIGNCLEYPLKNSKTNKMYSHSDGDTVISVPGGIEARLLANTHPNPIPYIQNQMNPVSKKVNFLGHNVSKDFLNKITGLFVSLNKKTPAENYLPEEQQLLNGSAISSPVSPLESDPKKGQTNPMDPHWSYQEKIVNTASQPEEACRPANGLIPTAELLDTSSETVGDQKPSMTGAGASLKENDGVGASWTGPFAKDITGSSQKTQPIEDKCKRPSTLPVHPVEKGLNLEEESDVDISKEIAMANNAPALVASGGSRKGVKRVQTPYQISARFSLIDDRIMSSQQLSCTAAPTSPSLLQAFKNVKPSVSVPNMIDLPGMQGPSSKSSLDRKEGAGLKPGLLQNPVNGVIVPLADQKGHKNVLLV